MPEIKTYVFVYRSGAFVPAGLLSMAEEGRGGYATFSYGNRYLARPDRIAVDPIALPLHGPGTRIEYRTEEGFTVFNGIRDAAPDGWGQYLMYKAMGDRLPSDADLLLASGDHRVGALAFGPTAERPRRITPWGDGDAAGERFDLDELVVAAERAQHVDKLDDKLRPLLTAGSSLGGARPKAATDIEGQPWIAKFPARNDTFPECRVELATMRLAARCGLDVPELSFREVLGRDIYLIRRFDRAAAGTGLDRIPFASGLTMLGAHESEASRHSYADLAGVLRRHGTRVRPDLTELFRRMMFNILVTNDDDHLRNHGFLLDGAGWRLSPLYDVVPKPQVGLERRLVLAVGPEGRLATPQNALANAAQFGLDADEARALTLELANLVHASWAGCFADAGIGAADRDRFATCFRQAALVAEGGSPDEGA